VAASPPGIGNRIAGIAMKMTGIPYVYGSSTPAGFDCSGLAHYVYAQAGISISRTSQAQQKNPLNGAGFLQAIAGVLKGSPELVEHPGRRCCHRHCCSL
jgi:cell wall-associated NlpC family hydrolase